jgi:DNA-binding transcriptional regulator GbsR (MarR family)
VKTCFKKLCQLYETHTLELTYDKGPKLEYYIVLQDFKDVFFDDFFKLSPNRDIDFSINLVLGVAPMSKTPYIMSTL